jgi:hypothetical protein
MTIAKGNTEKATKNMTLQMVGLTRSSSQEVADGYGPSIQKSELIADARSQGYRIDSIRDIVEPATINLEERDLFNRVMAEAISLKKENRCDGLCFSRCDRLSRRFDAALQIALDCKKNGLALRFVRENQWLKPGDHVRHEQFGEGVVVNYHKVKNDAEVVVAFDGAGVKRFLLSFARIEKV